MDFEQTKTEIEKYSALINDVEENDYDDITEVEVYEGAIRELIFEYCKANNYEVNGFPFVHLKKVENQEPGYDEDYLTWERMDYYIQRLALEKEDVFELCFIHDQHYFGGQDREAVRDSIKSALAMAESDNLSFDLTPEEIEEATREVKPYRPKLP
ncbi:MAG: hypothetical protein WCE57_07580 [Salegentibacter sp.]